MSNNSLKLKLTISLELLGTSRNPDGSVEDIGFPTADNAGIGLPVILEAISAGLTGDELTNTARAAAIGLAMGIQLGRDRNLRGFPIEAAFRQLRL